MKFSALAVGAAFAALASDIVAAGPLSARLIGGIGIYSAPTKDPFYQIPSNVSSYKEGDIIRERDVTLAVSGGTAGPLSFAKATQLLFRTQTALGNPDATVTTVFKPYFPASPPKVVSVALFEDSASKDCATSYALLSTSTSQQVPIVYAQTSTISALLAKGYYVTAPDYEGSQAAFIAGYAEGRVVLDSTRAILNHKPTIANATGNSIILTGYSGGGHAAAWAAQLSQEYAPELNIIGGAYGGVPVDLRATLLGLNKGSFAGFGFAGLAGQANAYPEVENFLVPRLRKNGTEAFDYLRSDQGCVIGELLTFSGKDYFTYTDSGPEILDEPVPTKYFKLGLLGGRGAQDLITKFPQYIYHASNDEVIPIDPVKKYVADQCAAGANIKFSVSVGTDHVLETINNIPSTLQWIFSRFDGTLKQDSCGQGIHTIAGAKTIMGEPAYKQWSANQDFSLQKLRSAQA